MIVVLQLCAVHAKKVPIVVNSTLTDGHALCDQVPVWLGADIMEYHDRAKKFGNGEYHDVRCARLRCAAEEGPHRRNSIAHLDFTLNLSLVEVLPEILDLPTTLMGISSGSRPRRAATGSFRIRGALLRALAAFAPTASRLRPTKSGLGRSSGLARRAVPRTVGL